METILSVHDLCIQYEMQDGIVKALNGVDFELEEGSSHGLVGETGAGKTTMAKGIMGLTPKPYGKIKSGEILYHGKDLLKMGTKELRKIRGEHISMIFQDPMTSLNPVITVGDQIAEAVETHQKCSRRQAEQRVREILELVGIAPERATDYPHQFSGGMKQRVVIGIALACNPKVLIADEPTTALDVTIQAQILHLMQDLIKDFDTSILFITHDLGVVAEMADRVVVMYTGQIVEEADVYTLFHNPKHPYTQGLLNSTINVQQQDDTLEPIAGTVPSLNHLPEGCRFHPRCKYATEACKHTMPQLVEVGPGHYSRCLLAEKEG